MLMDSRGSGKLVVVNAIGASDGVAIYTVPEGRTFVGKIFSSATSNAMQNLRINGVVVICGGYSGSGQPVTITDVVWPSNTVISAANTSSGVSIMGNEI